jgi:hypothetical protein
VLFLVQFIFNKNNIFHKYCIELCITIFCEVKYVSIIRIKFGLAASESALKNITISCRAQYVTFSYVTNHGHIDLAPVAKITFLYTILLLGFISTQCLIDMIPITD